MYHNYIDMKLHTFCKDFLLQTNEIQVLANLLFLHAVRCPKRFGWGGEIYWYKAYPTTIVSDMNFIKPCT